MRRIKYLLTVLAVILVCQDGWAAGKAKHVILVVWDGMRPDFVSPETTPTLAGLAQKGVTFLRHHPAYPSMTEVNGTTLATGVYPAQSTIIANSEFRPELDPREPIGTDSIELAQRMDQMPGRHYLAVPTAVEILRQHGFHTAVAGSKPVAMLQDRTERDDDSLSAIVFAGRALPVSLGANLTNLFGKFPAPFPNKIREDEWTTRALTESLWKDGVPDYSVLWMAEPDFTQHKTAPGSPDALNAIKSSDRNLARVLKVLKEKHADDSTDIIVVSDHGFSTITQSAHVLSEMHTHGFRAFAEFPTASPKNGDVLVVGNGGEVSVYVTGHDSGLITRLVHFFQSRPYVGVIFSQLPVDGAFAVSDVKMNSPYAPDIVFSMRWTSETNKYGVPGMEYSLGGVAVAVAGQHGSLGATDMHNTCIAWGPDFVKGMKDSVPSGNIDIAPTVLWLLGVENKMSGRVLSEAMTVPGPEIQSVIPRHQVAQWDGGDFVWQQYLDTTEVNGVTYFDKGDGEQLRRSATASATSPSAKKF